MEDYIKEKQIILLFQLLIFLVILEDIQEQIFTREDLEKSYLSKAIFHRQTELILKVILQSSGI